MWRNRSTNSSKVRSSAKCSMSNIRRSTSSVQSCHWPGAACTTPHKRQTAEVGIGLHINRKDPHLFSHRHTQLWRFSTEFEPHHYSSARIFLFKTMLYLENKCSGLISI